MKDKPNLKALENLLLRSLDGELTEPENRCLKQALETDVALQAMQADYLQMRSQLAQLEATPAPDFVGQVMMATQASGQMVRQIVRLWPAVAAAAVIAIVLGAGWIYGTSGSLEMDAIFGLDQLAVEDVYALDY